jgi:putative serine protease PepD
MSTTLETTFHDTLDQEAEAPAGAAPAAAGPRFEPFADHLPPPVPPLPSVQPPARPGRRRAVLFGAVIAAAALTGGATGWVSARLSDDGTPTSTGAASEAKVVPVSSTLAGQLDVPAVLAKVEPSVVSVQTKITQRNGPFVAQGEGAGTGIVLSADGKILTNAHVVADATSITVTLPGESTPRAARLIGADTTADVAVLQLSEVSGLTPAPLATASTLGVGDDVVAIGNALALDGGPTVTSGIVSALNRSIQTENGTLNGLIQTDAAISSGNSGGPLVNASGQVVGLNTAAALSGGGVNAENIGFAIPISTVLSVADRLSATSG